MFQKSSHSDAELLQSLQQVRENLQQQLQRVIVGHRPAVEELLVTFFAGGHAVLVGVPGLAKTLLVKTLATLLDLPFGRIQFTPDLMPSDITGTEILQDNRTTGQREFVFQPGPLFANFVLADEINRTPPKTQAALLEAMQEQQVTIGGKRYPLPLPFCVFATQNPMEQEGTYPLPESQQDRFMMCIRMDYPETAAEEVDMVLQTTSLSAEPLQPVLAREQLPVFQDLIRRIPVPRSVAEFAVHLVRASRPQDESATDFAQRNLQWGAGPRASQCLIQCAKSFAALRGEPTIGINDVKRVAIPVLRHRLLANYAAQAEGTDIDLLIQMLLQRQESTYLYCPK